MPDASGRPQGREDAALAPPAEVGPVPTGRRIRWVVASAVVLVAVGTATLLGTAGPTAKATLRPSGFVAGRSGVGEAGATHAPPPSESARASSTGTAPTTQLPPTTTTTASAPPSTVLATTTVPPTTTPVVPLNDVGIQVTGTGQASLIVVDGATESQVNDVTLPWSTVIVDSPSSVDVSAQSSDGSGTAAISCQVEGPGITPVTDSSSGPFATVSCGTTLGP